MTLYTGAFAAAIAAAGFVQFNAIEIVLPGPITIRLVDGSMADVTFSSKTFSARDATYGVLAGPPGQIEDGEGDVAPALTFSILPADLSAASTLCQAANQGAAITQWWGVLDPATGQPIGAPDLQFIGEFDVGAIVAGQNSRAVDIMATGVFDRLFDLDEGIGLNYATHLAIWPLETGLEFVSDVQASLPWGQDAQRANLVSDAPVGGFGGRGGGGLGGIGIGGSSWFYGLQQF